MMIPPRAASASSMPAAPAWTCPFCPLLCDAFTAAAGAADAPLALVGSDCPRAAAALANFGAAPSACAPRIGGVACELDAAVDAAAHLLAASHLPLFGGLGTDVAGARALYPLACATGAICDAAQGAALQVGVSALQDRGAFTTTLAEVRTRADLIVCVGGWPGERYPELFHRFDDATPAPPARRIVVIDGAGAAPSAREVQGIAVEVITPWPAAACDLFDSVALLAALVDGRPLAAPAPAALAALAAALKAARYGVLVWQAAALPAQGALIVEAIQRIVNTLNRSTRAAAFPLGGGDGASTVNHVFTWMSGLPLRSRAGPRGLEHEPLRFDAARLLADGAVDALLWIASFGTEAPPPATGLPTVVLGHPAFATSALPPGAVFIPVSTPGIGSPGHLFRTDGAVLMPLAPLYADRLPTVAEVLRRLTAAVGALRSEVTA